MSTVQEGHAALFACDNHAAWANDHSWRDNPICQLFVNITLFVSIKTTPYGYQVT